ncbi:hypothetical protein BH09SUM1_BH09SUM1_00190 [soil metagenome]
MHSIQVAAGCDPTQPDGVMAFLRLCRFLLPLFALLLSAPVAGWAHDADDEEMEMSDEAPSSCCSVQKPKKMADTLEAVNAIFDFRKFSRHSSSCKCPAGGGPCCCSKIGECQNRGNHDEGVIVLKRVSIFFPESDCQNALARLSAGDSQRVASPAYFSGMLCDWRPSPPKRPPR